MVLPRLFRSNLLKVSQNTLKNHVSSVENLRFFSVSSIRAAADRLYTKKHEWVQVDGEIGTVGISNHAQEALGEIVYAQLPDVGTKFQQSDECGALESVKAASEVYTPVSGTVTEKNTAVEDTPGLINTDCYSKGWLFRLKLSDSGELKKLMNESQYQEFLKTDDH